MDPPRQLFVPARPRALLPRTLKVPVPVAFACPAPLAALQETVLEEKPSTLLIEDNPGRARDPQRAFSPGRVVYRWCSGALVRRMSQTEFNGAVRSAIVNESLLDNAPASPFGLWSSNNALCHHHFLPRHHAAFREPL